MLSGLIFIAGMLAALLLFATYAYSGLYDIAADAGHWQITTQAMEAARKRSVERRAREIAVPDLNDEALVLKEPASARRCARVVTLRRAKTTRSCARA